MSIAATLSELEALGTEQNRKVYRRHGVKGEQFGLSTAHLNQLAKRYKRQHELALQLWASGNHDARMLATRIADPARLDEATIDAWVEQLDNYVITDAFCELVSQTPLARQKMERWVTRQDEWPATAGWNLLGLLAIRDQSLPDSYFEPYLEAIQRSIHGSMNRVRYAMNQAMIAIGTRNHTLEPKALHAAARVGEVHVDHGETNCQTPFAVDYIRKTWDYRQKKAAVRQG